jgi:hypothetical protein
VRLSPGAAENANGRWVKATLIYKRAKYRKSTLKIQLCLSVIILYKLLDHILSHFYSLRSLEPFLFTSSSDLLCLERTQIFGVQKPERTVLLPAVMAREC